MYLYFGRLKMDLNNLNKTEVEELLKVLKYPKNKTTYSKIYQELTSFASSIKEDLMVYDIDYDLEYKLHIYRGKYEQSRFSISIRFKENNKHLLRLDVNPSNIHENPDGSKITGSHYHLYSNNFEKVDRVATPIPKGMFPNLDTIIEAFIDFESYVNIKS
jgi:hypothetical protein